MSEGAKVGDEWGFTIGFSDGYLDDPYHLKTAKDMVFCEIGEICAKNSVRLSPPTFTVKQHEPNARNGYCDLLLWKATVLP